MEQIGYNIYIENGYLVETREDEGILTVQINNIYGNNLFSQDFKVHANYDLKGLIEDTIDIYERK